MTPVPETTDSAILIADFTIRGSSRGDCLLRGTRYADGSPALILTALDGEPIATVTVNLAGNGYITAPGAFFVKDYSENSGIAAALEQRGIISATGRTVALTFEHVAEYELTDDYAELLAA